MLKFWMCDVGPEFDYIDCTLQRISYELLCFQVNIIMQLSTWHRGDSKGPSKKDVHSRGGLSSANKGEVILQMCSSVYFSV